MLANSLPPWVPREAWALRDSEENVTPLILFLYVFLVLLHTVYFTPAYDTSLDERFLLPFRSCCFSTSSSERTSWSAFYHHHRRPTGYRTASNFRKVDMKHGIVARHIGSLQMQMYKAMRVLDKKKRVYLLHVLILGQSSKRISANFFGLRNNIYRGDIRSHRFPAWTYIKYSPETWGIYEIERIFHIFILDADSNALRGRGVINAETTWWKSRDVQFFEQSLRKLP